MLTRAETFIETVLTHIEMFAKTVARYHQRRKGLLARGWYRNLAGGITDPHCMASLSKKELWELAREDIVKEKRRNDDGT